MQASGPGTWGWRLIFLLASPHLVPASSAYDTTLLNRLQDAADPWLPALGLWWAAGDPLREDDTMRRFSATMGRLCRGREAVAAANLGDR
jgi:hypothetical protein